MYILEHSGEIHEEKDGISFYKKSADKKIWWVDTPGQKDLIPFSFDQKLIFNFWTDYPDKLTPEQIEIFKKENPTLAALK